jgi:non-ribosomal peptide synthetase component F
MVGLFINTLVLRNYPAAHKPFDLFLEEVKDHTLSAFENQDYPFDRLVERLGIPPHRGRNPVFDTAFIFQNSEAAVDEQEKSDVRMGSQYYGYKGKGSKFDIALEAFETPRGIFCYFQYCTALFKPDTIRLMIERFRILIGEILANPSAEIRNLDYLLPLEREMKQMQHVEFDF